MLRIVFARVTGVLRLQQIMEFEQIKISCGPELVKFIQGICATSEPLVLENNEEYAIYLSKADDNEDDDHFYATFMHPGGPHNTTQFS